MRDKQIEEMANVINEMDEINAHYYDQYMQECEAFANAGEIAQALYNAGYRKASEVAREIFEEIERYLRLNEDIVIKCKEENGEQNREYFKGKLAAYLQIRGFIDIELKRQYKEGQK